MAAYSNRSPSPLSTRPVYPNIRNSESNIGATRSLSRNHFSKPSASQKFLLPPYPRSFYSIIPVNSPSDFARRRSLKKEGIVTSRDYEEKENSEKDHNIKNSKDPVGGYGFQEFYVSNDLCNLQVQSITKK
ncbi:uncharacterized protein Fot_18610 [Forsythia ovata]|uniref:Uncharacterized protein n=1 Tax=Forsythia ovata TaxID=205694 RepID=A0ABD1VIP2_9LAMI